MTQFFTRFLKTLACAAALIASNAAWAITCKDESLVSAKLITDICWECLFPIRIAGATLASGESPSEASGSPICLCEDSFGVKSQIGMLTQFYEPARAIETQLVPGCISGLGGVTFPANRGRMGGGATASSGGGGNGGYRNVSFHHTRYYSFPLLSMLEVFNAPGCQNDGLEFDLLYASEYDPTWNNEALAFFAFPETAAVANPIAVTACSVDAAAANTSGPLEKMFYCSGSQGLVYPVSGFALGPEGMLQASSLLNARVLAAQHRRGFAKRTYGSDAYCTNKIDTFLPKQQYKVTQWAPLPETQRARWLGESPMKWGAGKTYPSGASPINVVWRWRECCMQ